MSPDDRPEDAPATRLVAWARRIESIAATGLHYTDSPYDVQRYEYLRDVAAEMFALAAGVLVLPPTLLLGAAFPAATRLAVKPGITGLWQLRGPRNRAIHEAIEWDLYYVENWSLRLDFAILIETLTFVFRARNH